MRFDMGHPVRICFFFLCTVIAVGCGKRPGVGIWDPDGSVAGPDGSGDGTVAAPDGSPPPECVRIEWPECQPVGEPVQITDEGDMPDVAWTGNRFLVVTEKDWGNEVVALNADGMELFREDVDGIQFPRIAWNPVLQVGLVAVDSGLRWLDSNGRPTGDYVPANVQGYQLSGDLAATQGGFFLFNGTNIYGTPPPFDVAVLGPTPGPIVWQRVADWGPRSPAEHVNGPDGRVRWVASTVWYLNIGELYRVDQQGLVLDETLDGVLPQNGEGFVAGLAEYDDRVYMLYGAAPVDPDNVWTQWVIELWGDEFRRWRIDRSHNGSDGHLLTLGSTLLVASSSIHSSYRVSLATFNPYSTQNPIGGEQDLYVLGGYGLSRSARMALSDVGFAVTWWEEGSVNLQIFDCCLRRL
jgi:hypothetical protein